MGKLNNCVQYTGSGHLLLTLAIDTNSSKLNEAEPMCKLILLCVVVIVCLLALTSASENDWPIIGVFTQPSSSSEGNCNGECMYLAASYVKYLEAAGARVVPINYSATTTELDALLSQVSNPVSR